MINDDHAYYLNQMGVTLWTTRKINPVSHQLFTLEKQVAQCQQCTLHQTRTQSVFARGNSEAKLMIIGEAPGFHEDKQGLPFVGRAGLLLQSMLKGIGLNDEQVYIANVLKCRPPENRDPSSEEIQQCGGYLLAQIELIAPKLILALGRFAGQFLINKPLSLNKMRGEIYYFNERPVIVSYHPAYLLRNPLDKKKAYQDLLVMKAYLDSIDNCSIKHSTFRGLSAESMDPADKPREVGETSSCQQILDNHV